MAKDEPNKPEEMTTGPVGEVPAEEKAAPDTPSPEVGVEAPAPEPTAEAAAALAHEGKEPIEPPAPSDIGGEHIPTPGDVVVPSDKINELMSERKPSHRGRLPKADKAEQAPVPENSGAEKSPKFPKKERKPHAAKQKPRCRKKGPGKGGTPRPGAGTAAGAERGSAQGRNGTDCFPQPVRTSRFQKSSVPSPGR